MKCHGCGFERTFTIMNPTMFCPMCGGFFGAPKKSAPRIEPKQATSRDELRHYETPKPIEIFIA
jgi:hypothetical protein